MSLISSLSTLMKVWACYIGNSVQFQDLVHLAAVFGDIDIKNGQVWELSLKDISWGLFIFHGLLP